MTDSATPTPATNSETGSPPASKRSLLESWCALRGEIPGWQAIVASIVCVTACFVLWWVTTRGPAEERILSPAVVPGLPETFKRLPELWDSSDEGRARHLFLNTSITLRRVTLGFMLAIAVGVPLGILAGCFRIVEASITPLLIFGRNIPIAALTMLTFFLFGIGEFQKVMFIFIATAAFIVSDSTQSVKDVGQRYIDTAYTLGASRLQIILKVLVPLSLPSIFNSLRVLFGLAFGYIMLAELVKLGNEAGGLGNMILVAQRRGIKEYIYLIVLIIPVVAFVIDYLLYIIQCNLFAYRYKNEFVRSPVLRLSRSIWSIFWKPSH